MPTSKLPPEVRYGTETLRNIEAAARLEWLETNGLGGFSSSSILGINTRRYHGFLVGAATPPTGRIVLINKLEETVSIGGTKWELGANRFPGATHPAGHLLIEEFRTGPPPRWIYRLGEYLLEKIIFMPHGRNAAAARYRWVDENFQPLPRGAAPPASLRIRFFSSFRDYHHLQSKNDFINPDAVVMDGALEIKLYENSPAVTISHEGFEFSPSPEWRLNYEYEMEMLRGLDCREDLFSHGELVMKNFGGAAHVMAFMGKTPAPGDGSRQGVALEKTVEMLLDKEISRRATLLRGFEKKGSLAKRLIVAADQFIVERGRGSHSIIAGYPWFADWGRDTMISLPGLTLQTRRFELAKNILETFAAHTRRGLIPNNFPDRGDEPSYNSIDATLWFFAAAREYEKASGDASLVKDKLLPVFRDIIENLSRGTLYDIRVCGDGLLTAGNERTQLTWMDACVGGEPVTPRHGKAVEINALWHNALTVAADAAKAAGAPEPEWEEMAEKAKASFGALFWNEEKQCLFDVIGDGWADPAVRPNQIFALSLPHQLLGGDKALSVLETVERELLAPYGLRTLSPADRAYRGIYEGGPGERDRAYHQGPVWGWLLGPYVRAALNVRGNTPETREKLEWLLPGMERHLPLAGINSVSEIFDGNAPHEARGCIAQAWSVAEWLAAVNLMSG